MTDLAVLLVTIGVCRSQSVESVGQLLGEEEMAVFVRRRLLRAMDVGALLVPLLPAAFYRTKDLCTLWHLQTAESQGHLVYHALTVQCAQRVGYAVAMAEDGGSGKVDVLGTMPHDEVCLGRLCLSIAVGDVCRDDVVLRGILCEHRMAVRLDGNAKIALFIGRCCT